MKRIQVSQLTVGSPLPFSVYDENGNLLLSAGFTLRSESQLRALIERGLYADDHAIGTASGAGEASRPLPSSASGTVVEQLQRIRGELNTLLSVKPIPADNFFPQVLGLATRLQNACQKSPDACLAVMLLDRTGRYSIRHMVHVGVVTQIVTEGAGQDTSDCLSAVCAALTMNMSMLDLQDRLHAVQGGELTAQQRGMIRAHPEGSALMLERLGVSDPLWLELVRDHHEALDGSGYPRGLAGNDIPLGAQAISLADGYTARLERRPDRDAKMPNLSLRDVFLSRGKSVDPLLAGLLVKKVGIFPPGLIVELENGETALVTRRTDNANAPEVHSLLSPERTLHTRPIRRTTEQPTFAIKHPVPIESIRIRFNPLQFWAGA